MTGYSMKRSTSCLSASIISMLCKILAIIFVHIIAEAQKKNLLSSKSSLVYTLFSRQKCNYRRRLRSRSSRLASRETHTSVMKKSVDLSRLVETRSESTAIKHTSGGRQKKIRSIGITSTYKHSFRTVAGNDTLLSTTMTPTLWKVQLSHVTLKKMLLAQDDSMILTCLKC